MNTAFSKTTKIAISFALVFFLALAIFGWTRLQKSKSNITSKVDQSVQVEQMRQLPGGKFSLISDKTNYKTGDNIVVILQVDGAGEQIVSYDLLIPKSTQLDFVSARSLKTDYEFVTDSGSQNYSFTGYLKLDVTTPAVFKNEKLLEMTFKAKNAGTIDLSPIFEAFSTADSNLMTSNNQDVLGSVANLSIKVE